MTTIDPTPEKGYQKYAWVILFILGLLSAFSAVFYLVESISKRGDGDVGELALWLYALAVTYFGFRPGQRWAWYTMWIMPVTMALGVGSFIQIGEPLFAGMLGVLAILAVIGLLLPIRRFFPKQS